MFRIVLQRSYVLSGGNVETNRCRRKRLITKDLTMNWDRRIASVAPYAATAIAMLLVFMVFGAYFQY